MDVAAVVQLATAVVAVGGLALGYLGYRQKRQADDVTERAAVKAAENTAKSVATEASEAANRSLVASLARANDEITLLRTEAADDRKSFREQIAEVSAHVERCEDEKAALEVRVRELEMAR